MYVCRFFFNSAHIRAVRNIIRAPFVDNWFTLTWSPIMLDIARILKQNKYIPTTVEYVKEIGC